jgi:hypothetical protein
MALEALRMALRETLGAPSAAGTSAGWAGYSAPLGAAQPLAPNEPGWQPFPFRTETAEVLWRWIIKLLPLYTHLDDQGIIKKAVEESGISPLDLSPEDWRLLEMATEWRRNGTKGIKKPRIGGAPGGPFDPREYGHDLAKRGAP